MLACSGCDYVAAEGGVGDCVGDEAGRSVANPWATSTRGSVRGTGSEDREESNRFTSRSAAVSSGFVTLKACTEFGQGVFRIFVLSRDTKDRKYPLVRSES